MLNRKLALVVGSALFLAGLMNTASTSHAARGRVVDDSVAAELRGGGCQMGSIVACPGYGGACPASNYVTGGNSSGTPAGSSYCSGSCGELFGTFTGCYDSVPVSTTN